MVWCFCSYCSYCSCCDRFVPADPSWMATLRSSQSTAHPGGHNNPAQSAPVELRMHAVYSPGVLLLSQIVCADASQEGSASPATAAASALNDAWGLLQQHKEEAGLAACTAWSCRIFVTPEISRCLRSGMNVSRCCSSGSALREGGVATGVHADSSVPTAEGL